MADITIKVVETDGTIVATLNNAQFQNATWELNAAGSASFVLHNYDADALNVDLIAKEVQIFRDGDLVWWGVPTTCDASPSQVRFTCRGLLWYFDRRFIGKADRANFLANPEFEGSPDLTGWTAVNTTATADSTLRVLGTKSAQLVQATAQQDAYLHQTVSVTGTGVGSLFTLVAWYYVSSSGWLGEAIGKRGLTLSRVVGGVIQESGVFKVDGATPRDTWLRAETTVWVPPNAPETLDVRLYSPGGTIHWDAASLTLMESLAFFQSDGTDQVDIAAGIVEHLQDTAYDKSDLNIATSTTPSGVSFDRFYQFADHHNGGQALHDFTLLDDGFDYDIALTTTTRTFTTYYPHKGTLQSGLAVTSANLVDWQLRFDGESACSSVTVLGDGDGPDREEGAATDFTVFDGVILEDVISARPGAPIDTLDSLAVEALRLRKVAQVLTLALPAEDVAASRDYIGTLRVGDTIPVTLNEGFTVVSGDWRIVRMTLAANDSLTLELNPA